MPQQHMPLERFQKIIKSLPDTGLTINLQGEGEPFLHPQFEDILRITTDAGYRSYTISNGTVLPPALINKYFPNIGVSVDTVDTKLADKIGRLNLPKVMRNLQSLIAAGYPAERITVHTVYFGQNLGMLKEYLRKLGIKRHVIQPLQVKEDYRYRYANVVPQTRRENRYRCDYIDEEKMLFFNIDGTSMPCCYIKRPQSYISRENISSLLGQRIEPECCRGCRELH
jgi:MoaA/NifB/PqqE/SkfB family radical SAM enzyme